ncbi:MAG: S8 family serine peptidase [bacterium]
MRRSLLASLVLLALAVAFSPVVLAGEIESNFAAYLQTIGEGDFASAIVYLNDHPNIKAVEDGLRAAKASRQIKHQQVLTALKSAADRSQPAVLNYLGARMIAGTVRGFTPYWIHNMVVISATKAEIEKIAARPEVEAVEANFRATLIESAGEPYMGSPTAGIGVTASLRAINADRVWYELGITGAGTLIGGLDTGVQGTHPALSARWRGTTEPWQECWRDALGGGTTFPSDSHGHGTHTMGTMCGANHSTGDTVGVAFAARWIADNAINQGVGTAFDNDVLDAFQWFADPDANPGTTDDVPDVVQNSWGINGGFGYDYQDCDYRWQTAIDNCEAAGVVVIFSAGNEGPAAQTHRSPANICNSPTTNFSVGAVDAENYGWPYPIASFSSRGPSDCDGVTKKPEVSAPGVDVYSCYPGSSYTWMSGTSMAGPHVAGVVALMREANPGADVTTIKNALMSTARDAGTAGEDNNYGWGIIDAYAAVQAVSSPDTQPPVVTVTAPNGGETLNVGATFTIAWTATDDRGVAQTSIYYSYDGGTTYNFITNIAGNPASYAWTVPNTPSTQCLVRVYAYDAASNQGSDTSNAVFTIQAPQGPYVWVSSINLSLVTKGKSTYASAQATIRNQNNQAVANATVTSHWAGLTSDSDVFTTKRTGIGTCQSNSVKNPVGWWYFYIDNVTASGYTFRSDLGETQDAIYAGGIPPAPQAPNAFSVSQSGGAASGAAVEFMLNLPEDAYVSFALYNVAGQRVRTLVEDTLPAGSIGISWDGTGDSGAPLANGVYFYRVTAGANTATSKVMLVK